MTECSSSILKWYTSRPWMLSCDSVAYYCEPIEGGLALTVEGCGEKAFAPISMLPDGSLLELDSSATWLNSILSSSTAAFQSSCRGLRKIRELKIVSSGLRSISYEAVDEGGERLLIKALRRLESDNIEHLVLRYLTFVNYKWVPKFICNLTYESSPYIIITSFIDGFPAATTYVNDASNRSTANVNSIGPKIGLAISELHNVMMTCSESWCRPEPITDADIRRWLERISWRSSWLRDKGSRMLPYSDRPLVYEAADSLEELVSSLEPLAEKLLGRTKLRIHGDLHLYQIVESQKGDIYITDFEGEPYKMPASKLEKEPAVRDLAALARSIDYAAMMGEQLRTGASLLQVSSWPPEELLRWEKEAFRSILESYVRNAESKGLSNLLDGLSSLFFWLVERASYESVYEIIARTGYHYVPLNAIIRYKEGFDELAKYVKEFSS
ncbi:Trehalose synthase [Acidilobus saccharovorans 345-15]|uniref:Trehalose synthase n=1 Tax=Acidilobus saccharovorans (strain DSM 16705 / JCM 18335 / VKM B-2471 / 345-15) TaxID=666510 RepID=D9Q0A3_ACIS3|nr:trehalose synthase [Acidilobus saccharovorans]ADL18741.1 Trehalose synthase [Acidilobus saccharovorans 345-15]